jgi:hypothetical protein
MPSQTIIYKKEEKDVCQLKWYPKINHVSDGPYVTHICGRPHFIICIIHLTIKLYAFGWNLEMVQWSMNVV